MKNQNYSIIKFKIKRKYFFLLNFKNNRILTIHRTNFDFFNVDEKLNNEINRYTSSYSGKDKEILEF